MDLEYKYLQLTTFVYTGNTTNTKKITELTYIDITYISYHANATFSLIYMENLLIYHRM